MYFKHIKLENVGPVENLDFEFPLNEGGTPKPVFFVGENGSGKSIVLSHLVNLLVTTKQMAYADAEVENGKVYKLRSYNYITTGKQYSYSKVSVTNDSYVGDWVINNNKAQLTNPPTFQDQIQQSHWDEIPQNENTHFFQNCNDVQAKELFLGNSILYFPPNRFEEPAWLNSYNLNIRAEYTDLKKLSSISDRLIFDFSPLKKNQNWILDLLVDSRVLELKIREQLISTPSFGTFSTQKIDILEGYTGQSTLLYDEVLRGLNIILGQPTSGVRFGISPRQDRKISIIRTSDNQQLVPNIFQLSTGETLLVNLFISILRDFDLARKPFTSLAEVTGIVVIDEIDMHLHTSFQRTVLPKLIKLFPKVQFIATTHSPLLLLGLEEELGADKITIVNLPEGREISVSSFSEFGVAYEAFKQTQAFEKDIVDAVRASQKPLLYVEGKFDKEYIIKSAELLQKTHIIDNFEIYGAGGSGNLENLWSLIEKTSFGKSTQQAMVLLYDFDTKVPMANIDNKYRRIIPDQGLEHLRKGIENLFPTTTIDRLEQQYPEMIDVSGGGKKRGIVRPIEKTVNENEKQKMCATLCQSGVIEDFANFIVIFNMLEEILSEIGGNNVQ